MFQNRALAAFIGTGLLVLIAVFMLMTGQPGSPTPTGMTLASGFEIELAAAAPLVERPMIIDTDEQGHLYVAESSGSNAAVEEQLVDRPHSILRLEDTDGDGRYDKRVVFADKMMFPEGVMWYDGSLYVAAPPSIWKLTDTDGDGVADKREEWYNGETLTHCANDLHGPYLGLDGWIYWCKGAFAEQTHPQGGDRPPLVSSAAHVFRRHPDSTIAEPVLSGGMDNPVEVAFSPEGERFVTATFVVHPQFGQRDGLIHAVYGAVYGKIHNVTDSLPMTGGYMDPMINLGPAVPVGLTYYTAPAFGGDFARNIFVTLFNMHKLARFKLKPAGSTFEVGQSDFLVSKSQDFHPTDVMEDADGSLLVVDTGGWYKLCCPTSQLAKPDVLGAIYRIRRRGAPKVEDPRGLALDWKSMAANQLAALLGDERSAVRKRAILDISKKKSEALPALHEVLKSGSSVTARQNAIWALTRISLPEARAAVRDALSDKEESVRQAAAHSISAWRDTQASAQLQAQIATAKPPLQRAAAEALGRLGDPSAVASLLTATGLTDDKTLLHSLTFALIEIADPEATRQGLRAASPQTRRAAMIALDQMRKGGIPADTVIPLLSSNDSLLRETAGWIAGHHADWGGALSGFFRNGLENDALKADERAGLERELGQFTSHPAIQALLADIVRKDESTPARISALRVMAKAPLKVTPPAWNDSVIATLDSEDADVLTQAVSTARALPVPKEGNPKLDAALLRVGRNAGAPTEARVGALAISAKTCESVEPELFDFLVAQIDPGKPVAVRGAAARALGAAPLSPPQLTQLTDAFAKAGPLETPALLAAYDKGGDAPLGDKLLSSLSETRGFANLRPDLLETALKKFPESVQKKGEALLASLDVDRGQQQHHLETLLSSLEGGDIRRGQAVFNSTKMACSSCHRIGYLGGRIGPDLTRVGEIRTKRDILEAVVYPSASFVRSYEPIVIRTSNDVYNGVPVEESEDYMLLATGADTEVRLSRSDILEQRPGTVSVMPSGLEKEMSKQDLSDLVAFLKGTHWGP